MTQPTNRELRDAGDPAFNIASTALPLHSTRLLRNLPWGVLLICLAGLVWLHRSDAVTRLQSDFSRWVFEATQSAHGAIPYRDVFTPFPPLSSLFAALWIAMFGNSFVSIHCFLSLLSVLIAVLGFKLLLDLNLKPWLAVACVVAAVAIGFVSDHQALFSLKVYVPAVLIGLALVLFTIRTGIRFMDSGSNADLVSLSLAMGVSLIVKLDTALAASVVFLATLFMAEKRPPVFVLGRLAALAFSPAIVVYAVFFFLAGGELLIAGLKAYGAAQSELNVMPSAVTILRNFAVESPAVVLGLWAGAVRGCLDTKKYWERQAPLSRDMAASLAAIFPIAISVLIVLLGIFAHRRIVGIAVRGVVNSAIALMPGYLVGLVAVLQWARVSPAKLSSTTKSLALASLGFGMLSIRAYIWGPTHYTPSEFFSALMWAAFFFTTPQALDHAGLARWTGRALAVAGSVFLTLAIGFGWLQERAQDARSIQLAPGRVSVPAPTADALSQIYGFIATHTSPGETVFCVLQGSGFNYLVGRPVNVVQTLFVRVRVPETMWRRDLAYLDRAAPHYIVIQDENLPSLSENKGREDAPAVWNWIDRNYRPLTKMGNRAIDYRILVRRNR